MTEFLVTMRLAAVAAAQGVSLDGAQPLAGDGSERRFFRLMGSPTKVLLWHPLAPGGEVNENDAYFRIGRHLRTKGAPVPEIYHYCREECWMLLEDLGDIHLESALKSRSGETQLRFRYRQALEILARMQVKGLEGFDPAWCFDTKVVDGPFLLDRECGYFVGAFCNGHLGLGVDFLDLAPDFEALVNGALAPHGLYFLHRDFQSRNLMVKDGRLRIIDFQGARLGPLGYDAAALLIDPYAALAPKWQEEFLDYYLQEIRKRTGVEEAAFRRQYRCLALCRNLQILGAFGFLTKVKNKPQFARHIPAAVKELQRRLGEKPGEFPRLERVTANIREKI